MTKKIIEIESETMKDLNYIARIISVEENSRVSVSEIIKRAIAAFISDFTNL